MTNIKTLADAYKATGMPSVIDLTGAPAELRDYFQAQYEAIVVTKALVGDWKADWNDGSQRKWFPWFRMSSGVFVFDVTCCAYSCADAGRTSRLCFPTEEIAEYAGKTFTDIYSRIILK